jgi:N4-(beta-N-acetylglucosaminyl)-L-asparaginase
MPFKGETVMFDISRRSALGLAAATATSSASGARRIRRSASPATIVSTWDFGAAANSAAFAALKAGGSILDAVEAGAKVPEADPENHSVGYGGYPDRDGHVTCDAVIMDDAGNLGSVAALEDIVHAVSVARRVMEKTPHVMLVGEGARNFAVDQGFPITNLLTPAAEAAWKDWLKTSNYRPIINIENQRGTKYNHDTIGILGRTADGRLAGACTTSGMAFKMHGRVGDSPLSGCGLFVERGVGAATSSGVGEEVIRTAGSARVVHSMRAGMSPMAACREAVAHIASLRGIGIKDEQVGYLALAADGSVGAFAIQPGFTYAVTSPSGHTEVRKSGSLFKR